MAIAEKKQIQPVFSIVTVVYNARHLLELTIESIISQTYEGVEYIIVDGGSTDGTVDIIKKYKSHITKWISEPDKGLYDAMNKGLQMATGDYVWFVNAGDTIYSTSTLSDIVKKLPNLPDIIFGEVMLVDEDRHETGIRSEVTTKKLPLTLNAASLKKGMVVSHQGFLPKLSITRPYMDKNLSADIDWVINCLKESKSNFHTHQILATYLTGGVSKQRHYQSLKDRFIVMKKQYGLPATLWAHLSFLFQALFHKIKRTGKDTY